MIEKYYGEQVEFIDKGFRGLRFRYVKVKGHTATVVTKVLTLKKQTISVEISTHPTAKIQAELDQNYISIGMDVYIGSVNLAIEWVQNLLG